MKAHYSESIELVQELFGEKYPDINSYRDTATKCADGINCGVLSLLFVEMNATDVMQWSNAVTKSREYFRLRT